MKHTAIFLCLLASHAWAETEEVKVHSDGAGYKLTVDGKAFFVKGMNWGYFLLFVKI